MKHFPFLHQMKIIRVEPYWDVSYGGKAQATKIYKSCKCGKTEYDIKLGWWTKEELTARV